MGKHAYLIMAHHRPDILQRLLDALDHPENDVYLHICKKSGHDMDAANFSMKISRLVFIEPMSVNWGGYSQIECTMRLLENAAENGPYDYYHLMTGATYPIKDQDFIHDFFRKNAGKEIIDYYENDFAERVKYYWLFNEGGKKFDNNFFMRIIRLAFIYLQKILHIDRFKKFNMECKKGLAYWSITDEFAHYMIERRDLIKKMMKHSFCGDENFAQILIYNSPFRKKIYIGDDGKPKCMRMTTWPIESLENVRDGHNFIMEDISKILESDALFALKFEGIDSIKIINAIDDKMKKISNKMEIKNVSD